VAEPYSLALLDALKTMLQAAVPGIAEFEIMPAGDPAKFPSLHIIDRGENVIRQYPDLVEASMAVLLRGHVQNNWKSARQMDADLCAALASDPQIGGRAVDATLGGLDIETVQIDSRGRTTAFQRLINIRYTYRATSPDKNF